MQSEWKKGAASMRDNVLAHIIGMQSDLGNDVDNEGYQELQKLMNLIEDRYGKMFGEYLG